MERKLADLIAKDGFIADKNAVTVSVLAKEASLFARDQGQLIQQVTCEKEELFVRGVLTEGDEVHLVVAPGITPVREKEAGRDKLIEAARLVATGTRTLCLDHHRRVLRARNGAQC